MDFFVESLSPSGINMTHGFANTGGFLDVLETKKVSIADGVTDRNRVLSLSDICINCVSIDSDREIDFMLGVNEPVLEMTFSISASSAYHIYERSTDPVYLQKNQHSLVYYPITAYRNSWRAGKNREMITILVAPSFAKKYIPEEKTFSRFLTELQKGTTVSPLCNRYLPITLEMYALLKEIVDNKHSQSFKRMYIESKVLELLMLQMEQFDSLSGGNTPRPITKRLWEKVHEVRHILESNLYSPFSLIDLAQQVGTNEYYLKKAFKQEFSTTVYGYLTKIRMQEAKRLLSSEELNVNEVAEMMGYSDSTNFTAAFKKHFGYTPSKIRTKNGI